MNFSYSSVVSLALLVIRGLPFPTDAMHTPRAIRKMSHHVLCFFFGAGQLGVSGLQWYTSSRLSFLGLAARPCLNPFLSVTHFNRPYGLASAVIVVGPHMPCLGKPEARWVPS
jgi:hypothetical protein